MLEVAKISKAAFCSVPRNRPSKAVSLQQQSNATSKAQFPCWMKELPTYQAPLPRCLGRGPLWRSVRGARIAAQSWVAVPPVLLLVLRRKVPEAGVHSLRLVPVCAQGRNYNRCFSGRFCRGNTRNRSTEAKNERRAAETKCNRVDMGRLPAGRKCKGGSAIMNDPTPSSCTC